MTGTNCCKWKVLMNNFGDIIKQLGNELESKSRSHDNESWWLLNWSHLPYLPSGPELVIDGGGGDVSEKTSAPTPQSCDSDTQRSRVTHSCEKTAFLQHSIIFCLKCCRVCSSSVHYFKCCHLHVALICSLVRHISSAFNNIYIWKKYIFWKQL